MSLNESGLAEVNGTRLYYEVAGAGPALALIHGFGLDRRAWDGQFAALARTHRVLRYDLRGFGRSALPQAGQGYRHIDDLAALLDHLQIEQAALVGLSLGGEVALDLALEWPARVSALALVDTIVSGRTMSAAWTEAIRPIWREGRALGAPASKRRWMSLPLFALARAHPQAGPLLRQMTDDWSGWQFLNRDPENALIEAADRLAEVRAPALVVVGEQDLPDFQAIADELAAGLPQAHKAVLTGIGHLAPMEAPEAFNALLEEWLR